MPYAMPVAPLMPTTSRRIMSRSAAASRPAGSGRNGASQASNRRDRIAVVIFLPVQGAFRFLVTDIVAREGAGANRVEADRVDERLNPASHLAVVGRVKHHHPVRADAAGRRCLEAG